MRENKRHKDKEQDSNDICINTSHSALQQNQPSMERYWFVCKSDISQSKLAAVAYASLGCVFCFGRFGIGLSS